MTQLLQGPMSPLRRRMIDDMVLAGLAPRTQEANLYGVRGLAARYRQSPDRLTEEQVRSYLLEMRERGVARGTFKTSHYGIQFLYRQTLGYDWALFGKKRFANPSKSAFLTRLPMPMPGGFLARSATRSIGAAFH